MRHFLWMALLVIAVGCSGGSGSVAEYATGPLKVEDWKLLDVEEKYEFETLERLRAADPKLKSERNWKVFMRDVVTAERKKDLPDEN